MGTSTNTIDQCHSQTLSPLPPFSLGETPLVAAGHVTSQNLGGKKICWTGEAAECFNCFALRNFVVSNPRAVGKTYLLYGGSYKNFRIRTKDKDKVFSDKDYKP